MKHEVLLILAVVAAFALGVLVARAQTSTTTSSLGVPGTAVAANCPAPVAGVTNYCFAADKLEVSPNGGAYVVIWPAGAVAAPALTLNGTTKTLPASFTVAVAAPAGTASTTVNIGVPAVTVQ